MSVVKKLLRQIQAIVKSVLFYKNCKTTSTKTKSHVMCCEEMSSSHRSDYSPSLF